MAAEIQKAARKAAPKVVKKAAPSARPAAAKGDAGAMPAEGSKAPAFSLPDDTGSKVRLADFAGKSLVLYFYPKDSTPGCTQESCDFRDNLNRLKSSGAAVVGVSADSVESHRRFKEKQGLNFPLLSDPGHEALEAYGVWREKSLYGRKFMGIVRSTFVIDGKGVIRKVFSPVKVAGHVDAVLAALRDKPGKPE
jgi:peroxiredoxin Q/BCP